MNVNQTVSIILISSFFLGFTAFLYTNEGSIENLNELKSDIIKQESVHKHALFYFVSNNSLVKFEEEKFQLNSGKVHLENNNSHIVHKHEKGITWEKFLDTISVKIEYKENETCIKSVRFETCNVTIVLNGEKTKKLNQEIKQGDNLVIILDSRNPKDLGKKYSDNLLPKPYIPVKNRGELV